MQGGRLPAGQDSADLQLASRTAALAAFALDSSLAAAISAFAASTASCLAAAISICVVFASSSLAAAISACAASTA
eukprot:CAMPEP_0119304296 /NCGR_PEP_ID=MMETSP1333-20130426/5553_1 /TAXON_ID=418940 /ORGANISM="Scyphosphaera apsteinii, Strain RCC1455" /LENGTH=75 /DNA_ID=CAMNT_0007307147 /DNA_START=588 /DNA_END=811 /DNA_ORIENTATION=+